MFVLLTHLSRLSPVSSVVSVSDKLLLALSDALRLSSLCYRLQDRVEALRKKPDKKVTTATKLNFQNSRRKLPTTPR